MPKYQTSRTLPFTIRYSALLAACAAAGFPVNVHARGFLRPGDYNTRFLLLVDGNRNNAGLRVDRNDDTSGTEFSIEQYLHADARLTLSLFRNMVSDLITQTMDPADGLLVFGNLSRASAQGVELELEQIRTAPAITGWPI
jgi:hypothetical protein